MSEKRFIQILQELLTMVDPDNPASSACVKNVLESLFALAKSSGKCDSITMRMMFAAKDNIDSLIDYRDDFAGRQGDYNGNTAKQQRLAQMLRPGC